MKPARHKVHKFHHPGAGRRRAVPFAKGRQLDPTAHDEVRDLLADRPRRRDLLIEHLHLLQDRFGCLSGRHMVALAEEMRLALAEVYEVATFYAHFGVVRDEADSLPAGPTVRVCDSVSCMLVGAEGLLAELQAKLPDARVIRAPCMGACDKAPAVAIGHSQLAPATAPDIIAAAKDGVESQVVTYPSLAAYRAAGGYELLGECRNGTQRPEDLIKAIQDSGLRGLGGAGFPTGRKLEIVRAAPAPRLMAINADEGEPGTFKDRYYLERDPHRFLEGMLLAAWIVGVDDIYIYLRDEYPHLHDVLRDEIEALSAAGLVKPHRIELRRGAGAYICGEESAMIESIEGKRGLPRHRPPYVAEVGLFDRPTLVNNVETMYWLRDIVENGPAWFADQGKPGHQGPRSFSVSGRVKNPGVKLAPAGISLRELIEDHCGGMADGHELKAFLPGGASGGVLPASLADAPLDFGTLEEHGAFIGSAAIVVFSQHDSMRDVALNLLRFFEDESCGQCTPCRVGTEKAVKLMQKDTWDLPLLAELSATMRDASICGLGQAAPNPFDSVVKYFPEDIAAKPGSANG